MAVTPKMSVPRIDNTNIPSGLLSFIIFIPFASTTAMLPHNATTIITKKL